ncbi:MAG: cation diffusion facilitator family transporter [Candidatus Binataceae bacterium]
MEIRDTQTMIASDRRRLFAVLAVTALYCATELAGGYYTASLALLSDAVHMFTDIAAICVSLLTLWISTRPAKGGKTYGYLRAEILGALFNGLFLWLLVIAIWFEAIRRLRHPTPVAGLGVMAVATVGIGVNAFSAWMTHSRGEAGRAGIAVRAVFVHVISDLIGTLGVLSAGAIVYFTGWRQADPVVSLMIGALIVYSSWGLIKEGVDILMEAVPADIDLDELRNDLLSIADTHEVHDLHVWCLTSREIALSAHAVVAPGADQDKVLHEMSRMLERKFSIRHMTVQLERDSRREHEPEHF